MQDNEETTTDEEAEGRGRVSERTREAERNEADVSHEPDRAPTPDEEEKAEEHPLDPDAAEHAREMNEIGAQVEGEGEIP